MAKVTEVRLVDDRDKGPADETVSFGLDGKSYTIDLSTNNATALRETLAEWIADARPDSGWSAPQRSRQRRSKSSESGVSPTAIREWARENGHSVSDRGRVSKAVQEAYAAAQSA